MRTYRIIRSISLGAALLFLVFFLRGEQVSIRDENKIIKDVLDKTLDNFASQFLSKVQSEAPMDLANALEIQSFLSCLVQRAEWRGTMGGGPKLVIPRTCSSAQNIIPVEDSDICQLLAGKRLLLVGPETTHLLHSLWLDIIEGRRNHTHTCPGRNYCTFHHICRDPPISPENADIYDRPERKKKMPSNNFLRASRSAVLQYTYSTTLYAGSNQNDVLYQFPVVDQEIGVQLVSQYWLRRARNADVIILNRAPIPAPVSTYSLGPSGNWTFASSLCSQKKHFPVNDCRLSLPCALANAALDLTLQNFLPSVTETIKINSSLQDSLRVWHGNWFIQPSCALKGLPRETQLLPALWSCTGAVDSCHRMDPWSYFYNIQVYLQDRILPRILPYYGIIYLPLTFPIVGQGSVGDRSEYVKDCIRQPWLRFPEELIQAFVIELSALLTLKCIPPYLVNG